VTPDGWRVEYTNYALNIISKGARPYQWARYSVAKTVIKLFNIRSTRIGQMLRQNSYVNDRKSDFL